MLVCNESSSPNFYWRILIFLFLAVLQIVGILLAFQTRKVKLHGLRDSKFIAAIIYISSIVLVVLALVTYSLRTYINIGGGLFASGILLLTTIFLLFIFLPKVNTYSISSSGGKEGKLSPKLLSFPLNTEGSTIHLCT